MGGRSFSFLGRPIVSCCVTLFQNKQTLTVTPVVMILRVWTMYNRSRLILGTLLMLFSTVIIATFLTVAIGSIPKNLSGT